MLIRCNFTTFNPLPRCGLLTSRALRQTIKQLDVGRVCGRNDGILVPLFPIRAGVATEPDVVYSEHLPTDGFALNMREACASNDRRRNQ